MEAIQLLTEQATPVSWQDVPARLKAEISLIKNHEIVLKDTITISRLEKVYLVAFSVKWNRKKRWCNHEILAKEPVVLVYRAKYTGEAAPMIYSNRTDFPRNLAHLNPVKGSSPVSFCVWRNGIQALYDSGGINRVLTVFGDWLSDAAQDNLEHDGWEPVPRIGKHFLMMNIDDFQRFAADHSTKKGAYVAGNNGRGLLFLPDQKEIATLFVELKNQRRQFLLSGATKKEESEQSLILYKIPWVFVWGNKKAPVQNRASVLIEDIESLKTFASLTGAEEVVEDILNQAVRQGGYSEIGVFILIFGIWRAKPLIPETPSDATGLAANIEIVPVYLRLSNEGGTYQLKEAEQVTLLESLSPRLLSKTSGIAYPEKKHRVTIAGIGAVGSKIADSLCRQGLKKLIIIDYDLFQPHNIARHILGKPFIGQLKAPAMETYLKSAFDVDVLSTPKPIQYANEKERKQIYRSKLLIDTSADKRLADYICNNKRLPRTIRSFISHQGKLGIIMVEGQKRNPRLDDLEATLFRHSIESEDIANWLQSESIGEHTIIGLSCSSVTFQIPDHLVSLHTANFTAKISECLHAQSSMLGGFGVHIATDDGYSGNWQWIPVPEFKQLEAGENGNIWEIRVHSSVIKRIIQESSQNSPNETGGFLYGRYNSNSRIVTIVETCCPKPLISHSDFLTLPAAAKTEEEQELLNASNNLLLVLGSWHSHPDRSSKQSPLDAATMEKASFDNNLTPRPYVMLIQGNDGISANIAIPTGWQ